MRTGVHAEGKTFPEPSRGKGSKVQARGWSYLQSLRICGSRVEGHAAVPVAHRAGHRSVEELHAQAPVLKDADCLVRPDVVLNDKAPFDRNPARGKEGQGASDEAFAREVFIRRFSREKKALQ